jgi:hypothetical protein
MPKSKASEGSRTLNPRITNAVLCRLKLRWQALQYFRHNSLSENNLRPVSLRTLSDSRKSLLLRKRGDS